MNNNKKMMYSIIGVLIILISLVGVTYSFFNYTRTGSSNTISVGRISFVSKNEETITLSNLFPIDPTEPGIMNDTSKVGTYEIEIKGDTDYVDGIEYLISTTNTNIHTRTGKTVPISIDVEITNLGTSSDSYFTARNSKNANIYKRLSGDSIVGEQQVLIGYIKPNTASGTIEGVDGKITIKAYLDKNKIAISDTYDGTESDNMGTTNEWANGRTVLTTDEWNELQANGMSFKVKVEANEGMWVKESLYNVMRMNAVMDNIQSTNVTNTTGIDFSKKSGDTDNDGVVDNGEGLYVRSGTENDAYPIVYYRGAVTDNNVYFGGFCWKIIRTTEKGGTKLIYVGQNVGTEEAPECDNTNYDPRITLEETTDKKFPFSGTDMLNSPAYSGYMYGTVYDITNGGHIDSAYFGNSFTYDEGTNRYTLKDAKIGIDDYHHYTCNLASIDGTCESIRYYSVEYTYDEVDYKYYFTLNDGKSIEDAVDEMRENIHDSNAKIIMDTWYEENLHGTSYEGKIEDTVYCNDRSIYQLGALNPNGGIVKNGGHDSEIFYSAFKRDFIDFNPSIKCLRHEDSFTVEKNNGNGKLDYAIGLITWDEIAMAGGRTLLNNSNYYLPINTRYWTMTPSEFTTDGHASNIINGSSGLYGGNVTDIYALQPVISLKNGTYISSGIGTKTNPYVIK